MSQTIERRYCFLYEKKQEIALDSKIDAFRLLRTPIAYTNHKYTYELLVDGAIGEDVTQYADYDVFWELIIKLWKDDSFYKNQTFRNYGASDVTRDIDLIVFTRNDIEWRIYLTFDRLQDEYPVENKYLVFFDENQTIEHDEMFSTMMFFVNNMGKENPYTNVKRYEYEDATKFQIFYVFYYGLEPDAEKCKSVIREELARKFGYDNAKERYPSLFIDSFRRIFLVTENRGYPINHQTLNEFIITRDIFRPEVILLLDWSVPIVVEYGLSDIIPNFTPVTERDTQSNQFIYFLSKVLNYLQGKVLTPQFIREAQFSENENYAAFVFAGVEWQVQKTNYAYPIDRTS
jgi:hypothetical protein